MDSEEGTDCGSGVWTGQGRATWKKVRQLLLNDNNKNYLKEPQTLFVMLLLYPVREQKIKWRRVECT